MSQADPPLVSVSEARKQITFEQAVGAAPLPSQLRLGEISQELRALLWLVFHQHLQPAVRSDGWAGSEFSDPWKSILLERHVFREHRMVDDFPGAHHVVAELKTIFTDRPQVAVFGLVEWVLRHRRCPQRLHSEVDSAFQKARSPYRVIDATIMAITSEAEGQAVERVFADPKAQEFNGARAHLRHAGEHLTAGDWASSIRESVHAVESVVRLLEPANKVSEALKRLEKAGKLHPSLKDGLSKLYGFTSDEQGIRHPLLEKNAAAVDETDALYMFGACAAFVTYLIGKGRKADLLEKP